jgi:hypothetical protein
VAGHENSRANTNGGIDRVFLPYSHADETAKQQGARTEHEQGGRAGTPSSKAFSR